MESSGKRTRGPNKQTPWARRPDDGMSVLRLALDTSDPEHGPVRYREALASSYNFAAVDVLHQIGIARL